MWMFSSQLCWFVLYKKSFHSPTTIGSVYNLAEVKEKPTKYHSFFKNLLELSNVIKTFTRFQISWKILIYQFKKTIKHLENLLKYHLTINTFLSKLYIGNQDKGIKEDKFYSVLLSIFFNLPIELWLD